MMRNWCSTSSSKHASMLLFALITVVAVAAVPQASHAQFIPCNIVSLKVSSPDSVQSGQLLQVTTTLQISCDPSTYPIIRLDLLDRGGSRVLSSASVPYPPSLSSFTVTGMNQAKAPSVTGSWPLEVQAYVINGISGQVAASSAQSFSVSVIPYTPPITTTQEGATISLSVVTSTMSTLSLPTTTQATVTAVGQTTQASETSSSASTSSTSAGFDFTQLLLPVAVVVAVALGIIGVLIARGRKRDSKTPAAQVGFCGQCGAELLSNAKFCGKCGAKQS